MNLIINFAVFSLSSLISIFLISKNIPIAIYQQIIVLIVVCILFAYANLFQSQKIAKFLPPSFISPLSQLVISLFVQLLVISTGGINSPFLILFHIFALALSFLIGMPAFFGFLSSAGTVLVAYLLINPAQFAILKQDPGTALLYLTSFAVIIPLAQIVSKRYHIKDQLTKILNQKVKTGESVISGLNDMVIVTDIELNIINLNQAAEKALEKPGDDILGKKLTDIWHLEDGQKNKITAEMLSINNIINDKTARKMSDLFLYTVNQSTPSKVILQIRPVISSDQVNQFSFIIHEGQSIKNIGHDDLASSIAFKQQKTDFLRNELNSLNLENHAKLDILSTIKSEEDILIASELEDHNLIQTKTVVDIADLANQVTLSQRKFAELLSTQLSFELDESHVKELSLMALKSNMPNDAAIPLSNFALPIDQKWTKIVIEKIIELAIFLNTSNKVSITPLMSNQSAISLEIGCYGFFIPENQQGLLLDKLSPSILKFGNLKYGSGLEGFIAKLVADQLNVEIIIKSTDKPPKTSFILIFPKLAR